MTGRVSHSFPTLPKRNVVSKDPPGDKWAICRAAIFGWYDIVEGLLVSGQVKQGTEINHPFILACRFGHIKVVELFLSDSRVNPAARDNAAIVAAARFGHIGVVKLLLNDTRVDPSARNNDALKGALDHHHTKIVKLLLARKSVSALYHRSLLGSRPSYSENWAKGSWL